VIQKVSEDIDYQLIPASEGDDQAWDVRLIGSLYPETVLRFGNIAFNEEAGCLNFNFVIISSPDSELTEDDIELQTYAGDILESILENAIADDALVMNERTNNSP
jgi:hypothetical protein